MNTFEGQIEVRTILNRPRAQPTKVRDSVAALAEFHAHHGARTVISNSAAACTRWMARDGENHAAVKFPFAFPTFITLVTGLIGFFAGCFAVNVSLAVTGFGVTSVGALLCAWSLGE